MIEQNLQEIRSKISEFAKQFGRKPDSVKLIAVSKTKPINLIIEAKQAGQVDFGENRVQELQDKHPELPDVNWHMIGHLQRNKVKFIAPFIHLIHSVDTPRLLAEVSKQAEKNNRTINCLLQVNISNESQKSGMDEHEVRDVLSNIDQYPSVVIKGFMGMAEFTSDREKIRNQFRSLKMLRESLAEFNSERIDLKELSMGMSGDYDIAIEEGATMVRIGSAVFGHR